MELPGHVKSLPKSLLRKQNGLKDEITCMDAFITNYRGRSRDSC
jgi:hypothetical protein